MTFGQFILGHAWHLALMLVLLVASAFFSFSETAFFSLSKAELLRFRQSGTRVGQIINHLMHNARRLLMVLLLGNLLVNISFFAMSAVMVFDLRHAVALPWLVEASLFILPALPIILFAEVGPKVLAFAAPTQGAQVVALPVSVLVRLLGPIETILSVGLIEPLTRLFSPSHRVHETLSGPELASAMEVLRQRRLLAPSESAWLKEVIELSRLKVADIMVPRVDMVAYDIDEGAEGLVQLFRRSGLKKAPVYRGSLDATLGVIRAKDLLLTPGATLESLVRKVLYVPESATVDKLLMQFRQTRAQLAIVVDEFGGTAGLVTLEDALEEIVGEISEEAEAEPVTALGDGEYLVHGNLAIHEWRDLFGIELSGERISTLGGWVMSLLGRVPRVGDEVEYRGLRFRVESMRRHRIAVVRLRLPEDRS